ncbi:MAG: hypothetical protein ACT4QE_22185 [Anaerolineales bacterium]
MHLSWLIPPRPAVAQRSYHILTFHLRAYYWELWSVWDYILQNANANTLKLNLDRVNTKLVNKIGKKAPSYTFLSEITVIRDSLNLKRIARLCHSAHQFVLEPYQVEINDKGVSVICLHMKDNAIPDQVNVDRNDLAFVEDSVQHLKNVGFFK